MTKDTNRMDDQGPMCFLILSLLFFRFPLSSTPSGHPAFCKRIPQQRDSMKSYPHELAQQKSLLKWPSSSPFVDSFLDLFLLGKLQAASLCIIMTFWVLCCPSWILGKSLGVRAWRVSKNHAIYKEISL